MDHFAVRMKREDGEAAAAAFVPWTGKRGNFVPWTGKREMGPGAGTAGIKRHPPLPLAGLTPRVSPVCFNNKKLQWSPRRNGKNCLWWLG